MRYNGKEKVENSDERYKEYLKKRDRKSIVQYSSTEMNYPTQKEMATLTLQEETWKVGSRLYKLAHKHYGDSSLWWVIAWFNKKPTEANFIIGDVVYVPLPLDKVLQYAGV